MTSVMPTQSQETSKIPNWQAIRIILTFCFVFWPVAVVYYLMPHFYFLMKHLYDTSTAINIMVFTKIVILGLTVFFHILKFGKSFSILLALGFGISQLIRSGTIIIANLISYPELFATIIYNKLAYILINCLLVIASFKTVYYLWGKCNYRELFSLFGYFSTSVKWIFNGLPGHFTLNIFDRILAQKKWILSFWFIPVIYIFWYKQIFFIHPTSNLLQIFKYVQVMAVPLSVLFVSLFLYKPCKLINRFGVVLAAITNSCAQVYGIIQYITYYARYFPVSLGTKSPVTIFKQINDFLDNPNLWLFLLIVFFFSIGLYIMMRLWIFKFKNEPKAKLSKRSTNYGTAKFLDLKGIRKINNREGIPIGAVPKVFDFSDPHKMIESIKKRGGRDLIRIKSDHTTLVAPSRTGKGTGIIIPILLEYAGPVFVTDVKGENYSVTKRAREAKGRKVIAFDPFGITDSPKISINLLAFLNPKTIDIVDDSQSLASLICPVSPNESGNTKHFQEKSAAIIQCLLLYVTCSTTLDDSKRNLSEIYDLLCMEDSKLLNFFATTIGQDHSLAYGAAARLANTIASNTHASEEQKSALSSARVAMRFIDTPYIREATSGSDLLLSDITKGELDLFICIPLDKLSTQYRLLRLITGIVFIEMQKARGKIGQYNLLMLLDEMPALGHMKQIEEMLVFGGGFGISLLVVTQTIEFLQSVYPHTWKTFFSNQLSIFFGCSEPMTAEFVSKKLGKKTIEISSANQSAGTQAKSTGFSETSSAQISDSLSETGRELLMPDEIQRLGNRVVLAFDRGEYPIICHRIDYRERSEWVGLWDENPLHANRSLHEQYTFNEYFNMAFNVLMN